jgi:hypothetical protein
MPCWTVSSPHLMVTDPPYGVSYDPSWRLILADNPTGLATGAVPNDDRADWREAWALFPGDVAYVWHEALHAAIVAESLEAWGEDMGSHLPLAHAAAQRGVAGPGRRRRALDSRLRARVWR